MTIEAEARSSEHAPPKTEHAPPAASVPAASVAMQAEDPREPAGTWPVLGRLWRDWLAPYKWRILAGIGLVAVFAATQSAIPLIIQYTMELMRAKDPLIMTLMPAVIIGITLIKGGAFLGQNVVNNGIVMRLIADMQNAVFAHVIRADLSLLLREGSGTLLSRFTNDVNALRTAMSRMATKALRDIVSAVFLVGTLFYIDWLLALMVFAFYPLGVIPISRIGQRLRKLSRHTQSHMGDMTAVLQESLGGARMVKAYELETYEGARAGNAFEQMYRLWMKNTHHKARLEPMVDLIGGVAVAGVVAFAGWRIVNGAGTAETFVAFITALILLANHVRALGNLNAVLQEGIGTLQRMFALLDLTPAIMDAPEARPLEVGEGRVTFREVRFSYESGPPALSDVSLEVPGGKTVALVGRSGAGKSTVFNLIPRFYEVSGGAVEIDGQDVRAVTQASLRQAMALVSQDSTLFNDTVRANIAFGKLDATADEIETAARAAAAHEFIVTLPDGYDTVVGMGGAKLSGGQRQRIALARAILKDAPILLLDEATSALDAESERLVQASLERLSAGRTTLVIAHRLATVRKADLIVVFDQGKIVEQGTHEALMARGGAYTQLAALQFAPEPGEARPDPDTDGAGRTAQAPA